MADAPKPWERQEGEGPKAFHAFTLYRDTAPHKRSLRKIAERLYPAEGRSTKGRNPPGYARVSKWSTENAWVDRCRAWDDEQDRWRRDVQQSVVREMAERHAKEAQATAQGITVWAQALVLKLQTEGLAKTVRKLAQDHSVKELTKQAVSAGYLLPMLHKDERLARGADEADQGQVVTVADLMPLLDDLREVLEDFVEPEQMEAAGERIAKSLDRLASKEVET